MAQVDDSFEKLAGRMLAALRVMVLDRGHRAWLQREDPQLLKQAEEAIRYAEAAHVHPFVHGKFMGNYPLDEMLTRFFNGRDEE